MSMDEQEKSGRRRSLHHERAVPMLPGQSHGERDEEEDSDEKPGAGDDGEGDLPASRDVELLVAVDLGVDNVGSEVKVGEDD